MYAISGSPEYTLLSFYQPMSCLSWAPFGGGNQTNISHIINRTLPRNNLEPLPIIIENLKQFIVKLNLDPGNTVAMVTTASQKYLGACIKESANGLKVMAIATVGLGNIVAPGEHTAYDEELDQNPAPTGTINIALSINRDLSPSAALELSSSVTLAKAATLAELNLLSKRNGKLCLATGTDCNTICWDPSSKITLHYAGLHTRLAELASNAIRDAMLKSLSQRLGTPYRIDQEIITLAQSRFSATR